MCVADYLSPTCKILSATCEVAIKLCNIAFQQVLSIAKIFIAHAFGKLIMHSEFLAQFYESGRGSSDWLFTVSFQILKDHASC